MTPPSPPPHKHTHPQVTGGDPAFLDGVITLCGRGDRDPTRFFTGHLASLQLWDWPLAEGEVAALYGEWVGQGAVYPAGHTGEAQGRGC